MKVWLVNCVPLSVMTLFGTPKWQTSPLKNLTADCAVTFLTGSTSGQFVNLSIATSSTQSPRQHEGRGPVCRAPRPKMARREGLFEGLELVDEASLNATDTLHTWLLVPSHPGGRWARRNLAGTPSRQGPSTLCGSHICLHVSLPTAPVLPPGGCTSISLHLVFVCTERCQRTDTGRTGGLLFLPLPAPQEAPLFGGIGRYAAPMPEPWARRQGPKASLLPWERLSLWPGLDTLPEPVALGQAQRPRQHPCRQPQRAR